MNFTFLPYFVGGHSWTSAESHLKWYCWEVRYLPVFYYFFKEISDLCKGSHTRSYKCKQFSGLNRKDPFENLLNQGM